MLTSARKGIPSTQMARELGITQKSAWFLAQRIRETWLKDRDGNGQKNLQYPRVAGESGPALRQEAGTVYPVPQTAH